MQLQGFYPIIVTEKVAECRDFYRRLFGLEIIFEASWFVLLGSADETTSVAFMHPSHPTAPPGPEPFSGKGMCLEFEVADAAAEYERFRREEVEISYPLRDEAWGQRRFGFFDPAGVWIDVVEQVQPVAGWWDRYMVADPEE